MTDETRNDPADGPTVDRITAFLRTREIESTLADGRTFVVQPVSYTHLTLPTNREV